MKRTREQVDGPVEGKVVEKQRILLSFDWDTEAVAAFADSMNSVQLCSAWRPSAPVPRWFRTPPPYTTSDSVVEDILAYLRPLVGGRLGSHMLTMATMEEYKSVTQELQRLVDDAFVQTAMNATAVPRPLASLYVKFSAPGFSALERSPVVATRVGLPVFT